MPRIPVSAWLEETVREKQASERNNQGRNETWNCLVREFKIIAYQQKLIFRRLDAYGERLRNVEREVTIAVNAAISALEEIEGERKARRVLEGKILKIFDFFDDTVVAKFEAVYRELEKLKSNN